MKQLRILTSIALCFLFFAACEPKEEDDTLTLSHESLEFGANGGTINFQISTSADAWSIDNAASDWLTLSATSGEMGSTGNVTVKATVSTKTLTVRTATLIVSAGNAPPVQLTVTQASSEFLYTITATPTTLAFERAGGSSTFVITSNAPSWSLTTQSDWLTIDKTTGSEPSATITVTTSQNNTDADRTGTITLSAENAQTVTLTVTQEGPLYPSYNTNPIAPDMTGVSKNAFEIIKQINLGWNLGNSLEVPNNETGWGNPKTTQALIDAVYAAGFNAVRIPCAWDSYSNKTTAKISDTWLARVKEVVDYCINKNMIVVINIHWDGGWLENNPLYSKQEAVNAKQKAFWEQIATYFRDYDEHLLFAGTNEVHFDYNTPTVEHLTVQMSFNQTFVDAVRSTGGKNAYRNLIVQSYNTNIDLAYTKLQLPTDAATGRLILETHYYDPWDFCGTDTGDGNVYYWGKEAGYTNITYKQEDYVRSQFAKIKSKFVNNGVPSIIGEYGALNRTSASALDTEEKRTKHKESRAYFYKYVTQKMKENGIAPFYWDNGHTGLDGFAVIDRDVNAVSDATGLKGLTDGAAAGVYPF